MDTLLQDLRHAARGLLRAPSFALGAVLTLALGIGVNTAIFSLVNTLLLRPLAFHDPERLVWVWSTRIDRDKAFFSIPNFIDTREQSRSFDRLVAFANWGANLQGAGEPERLQGVRIVPEAFAMLGAQPVAGRLLSAGDGRAGSPAEVALTYGLWQRRFHGDPAVVGRALSLNGDPYVVAGILPKTFIFPGTSDVEFAVPLNLESDPRRAERGSNFMRVLGRLADGATAAGAGAELAGITERLRRDHPEDNAKLTAPRVVPLLEEIVGGYRRALLLLLGAVGLVLLVACSNLAHLMLVRSSSRRREIAIRLALGASRARLARLVFVESALIAAVGGILGLVLAWWGKDLLPLLSPTDLPRARELAIDGRVLLFTFGACSLSALGFGLAPAWSGSRAPLGEGLTGAGRIAGSRDQQRARGVMVIVQVAFSLVLLVTAALFIQSLERLRSVDPGFDADRLMTLRLSLPAASYSTPEQVSGFYERLAPRLAVIPGVKAVGATSILPLSGMNARTDFYVTGSPPATAEQVPGAQNRWISAGYFRAMGIPLVGGREFTSADRAGTAPVVVIDHALARRFFPHANPVGAHLLVSDAGADPARNVEVVGVVEDVKHFDLTDEPSPTIYTPIHQISPGTVSFLANGMSFVIRTAGRPLDSSARVRDEVRATDPAVPTSKIKTMDDLLAASVASKRFSTRLLETFAIAALLLASVGLYAVVSFMVGLRRHEIGVRMALGARPSDVRGWVLGHGLRLALLGVAFGFPLALLAGRLAASQLYEIRPGDPTTLAAAILTLLFAAVLASYVPAHRASRVDPASALRSE